MVSELFVVEHDSNDFRGFLNDPCFSFVKDGMHMLRWCGFWMSVFVFFVRKHSKAISPSSLVLHGFFSETCCNSHFMILFFIVFFSDFLFPPP